MSEFERTYREMSEEDIYELAIKASEYPENITENEIMILAQYVLEQTS